MELFIYAVGISLVLLIAWIGYELYTIRQQQHVSNLIQSMHVFDIYENTEHLMPQTAQRIHSHLFDQEQP